MRTLLIGMLACQADGRPAHLVRVYDALTALDRPDQHRLGIITDWKTGPHTLTYRQVEYTFGRMVAALSKDRPDGTPSDVLATTVDALIEASVPDTYKSASTSVAVDWTDHETFSCPPTSADEACADPEASWGHRRGNHPGQKDETFYGYYFSAQTTVEDENGPPVPELVRAINLTACNIDPVPAFVPVLARQAASGITIGDVLADSGYAHRVAPNWATPLRAMGASIITDLHPHDRGVKGTHQGAILANGNLYCPATPKALLDIAPLPRGASPDQITAHDTLTAEAARHKLAPITSDDPDGYHRVICPAAAGKLRCPHRPESMALSYDHPTIVAPPEHPPACCAQKTITVAPSVNAKTRQKHDYPGPAWRASYARRTGVERTYSTLKDPARIDINRGWCRLMGLAPIMLFLTTAVMVRNHRIIDAYETRMVQDQHRAAAGLPPRTRKRRQISLADLADTG